MAKFELTPEQDRAVHSRGCPMLVSAAAGSGKTRVLTERLLARVEEGADIDRFLVITFTRAAAAELRSRIMEALEQRIADEPQNKRLRRQSTLLYRAQIGTIDSFCTTLVREQASRLGISPSFTVLEQERGETLRRRALDDVLDKAYENIDRDAPLQTLIEQVGCGRDDAKLAELVLSLHTTMQSRAFPEQWAEQMLARLDGGQYADAGETPWGQWLLTDASEEADYRAAQLEKARAAMVGDAKMEKAYGACFEDVGLLFRDLGRAASTGHWDETVRAAQGVWPPRLGTLAKYEDEAKRTRIKAVWEESKKAWQKLAKSLTGTSDTLLAELSESRAPLQKLMELVFALDAEYAARKRRAEALDFSDAEHFCVKLLANPDGSPTELAAQVAQRFDEVMVDEYQDVNAVQELIFRCLSGGGERLFVVGDVKQSVYRFRLADPSIFQRKYEAFAHDSHAERVLLRENFRSCKEVLGATNAVFGAVMSEKLGEIEYNDEARLIVGSKDYPEDRPLPELCVLDYVGDEDMPDKTMAEARYVAKRIRELVESRETILDHGEHRPVGYGDIAILLRTPASTGAAYRRALTEAGIPVNARQGTGFFEQPEIRFALSMLAVADNPRQDVPLIAALRGLPFGFTADELAHIRAADKGDLWTALNVRAETDERCRAFADTVRELRDRARELSTDALLRWLYDRTGLMAICCAMPDSRSHVACLMALYEYARRFEQDGYRGLFRFVSWLRALSERGEEPPAPAASGAVQIMSIHKSKGLEFPVVFLADTAHGWRNDTASAVLCHEELGFGMKRTDPERGLQWPTLAHRAIKAREKREELSEQLRVLYVAMTRAKERLIITCAMKKAEAQLAACAGTVSPVSPRVLQTAGHPAAWLMLAAAADGGRHIETRLVTPEAAENRAETAVSEPKSAVFEPFCDKILENIRWKYPFAEAVELPSKLTATEAKRLESASDDPEAVTMTARKREFRKPDFTKIKRPLTGTERGIAAHLVMQHIDLAYTETEAQIAAEIARLQKLGFLDARQAEAVAPQDILAFFSSELGQRVKAADKRWREFRFSLLCPAGTWFSDAPEGEEILLQGVIDLCIEERGALTVIDFKTDSEVNPELYAGQLRAYALAMQRITGKPVRTAELWYLRKKVRKSLALREKM